MPVLSTAAPSVQSQSFSRAIPEFPYDRITFVGARFQAREGNSNTINVPLYGLTGGGDTYAQNGDFMLFFSGESLLSDYHNVAASYGPNNSNYVWTKNLAYSFGGTGGDVGIKYEVYHAFKTTDQLEIVTANTPGDDRAGAFAGVIVLRGVDIRYPTDASGTAANIYSVRGNNNPSYPGANTLYRTLSNLGDIIMIAAVQSINTSVFNSYVMSNVVTNTGGTQNGNAVFLFTASGSNVSASFGMSLFKPLAYSYSITSQQAKAFVPAQLNGNNSITASLSHNFAFRGKYYSQKYTINQTSANGVGGFVIRVPEWTSRIKAKSWGGAGAGAPIASGASNARGGFGGAGGFAQGNLVMTSANVPNLYAWVSNVSVSDGAGALQTGGASGSWTGLKMANGKTIVLAGGGGGGGVGDTGANGANGGPGGGGDGVRAAGTFSGTPGTKTSSGVANTTKVGSTITANVGTFNSGGVSATTESTNTFGTYRTTNGANTGGLGTKNGPGGPGHGHGNAGGSGDNGGVNAGGSGASGNVHPDATDVVQWASALHDLNPPANTDPDNGGSAGFPGSGGTTTSYTVSMRGNGGRQIVEFFPD